MKNLILFVLLLSCSSALAQQGQTKVAIEKAWAEMDRAVTQFDGHGMVKHLRADFQLTSTERPGMKINKSQLESVMVQRLPQLKKAGGKLTSITLVRSLTKIDDSTVKVQTVSKGDEQESKTAKPVHVVEDREEIWVMSGGAWGCQSIHVLKATRK